MWASAQVEQAAYRKPTRQKRGSSGSQAALRFLASSHDPPTDLNPTARMARLSVQRRQFLVTWYGPALIMIGKGGKGGKVASRFHHP
jgi:hypothetical protein